jgi:hypothetical protein
MGSILGAGMEITEEEFLSQIREDLKGRGLKVYGLKVEYQSPEEKAVVGRVIGLGNLSFNFKEFDKNLVPIFSKTIRRRMENTPK